MADNLIYIPKSKLKGEIEAPISKSYLHRYLLGGYLSKEGTIVKLENVKLDNCPKDVILTIKAARAFGKEVIEKEGNLLIIDGERIDQPIDCGESGSTMRFLIPPLLAKYGKASLLLSKRLSQRGIKVYEELFSTRKIKISKKSFDKETDLLTLEGNLKADSFVFSGESSSQYATGMLFALPLLGNGSSIEVLPPVNSKPYIDITVEVLSKYGLEFENNGSKYTFIKSQEKQTYSFKVEGDYSAAAFLEALNYLGNNVTVENLNPLSLQGDKIYQQLFAQLNKGFAEIDISNCIDLGPILFAMASMLHGAKFKGVKRLRIKESDRLMDMLDELSKIGVNFILNNDDEVTIEKADLSRINRPLIFNPHNDHRIAMSLAVISTKFEAFIQDPICINKSYPDFFNDLKLLGSKIENRSSVFTKISIVGLGLIGGSIAKKLSQYDVEICGYDKDEDTLKAALKDGSITYGSKNIDSRISDADLIIFCLPIRMVRNIIMYYINYISKSTLILDLSSIKGHYYEQLTKFAHQIHFRYCSFHPMAGSEKSGYSNSRPNLFENCPFLIIDNENRNDFEATKQLAIQLGSHNIHLVSKEYHDELMAKISDLPHLISSAFANSAGDAKRFAGGSFKDMIRVSRSNPNMWANIYLENSDQVIKAVDSFIDELEQLKKAIESKNRDELISLLTAAKAKADKKED